MSDGPVVDRRSVLKLLGSLGVSASGAGLAAGEAATQTPEDTDVVDPVWTSTNVTNDRLDELDENVESIDVRQGMVNQLSYLGARWMPYGDPLDGEGGCYAHTFLLSGVSGVISREDIGMEEGEYTPEGSDLNAEVRVYAERQDAQWPGYANENTDAIAISPRRDLDLFGFYNQQEFSEALVEEEARMESLFADVDPMPLVNVPRLAAEAEANQNGWDKIHNVVGKGTTELFNRAIGTAVSGRASTVFGIAMTAKKVLADPDWGDRLYLDEGFENAQTLTEGAGGHYVMFDAYCSPGDAATFNVWSRFFGEWGTPEDTPIWEIELPANDAPTGNRETGRWQHARISRTRFDQAPRPDVARDPDWGESVDSGDTVTFDAEPTRLGDQHVASYEWTLREESEGPSAGPTDPVTDDGKTFTHEFDGSGEYRIALTVTGERNVDGEPVGQATGERVFTVGNPPTPEIQYESPVVQNTGTSFSAVLAENDRTIESYEWTIRRVTDEGQRKPVDPVRYAGEDLDSITHEFTRKGSYDVSVTATDVAGATGSATVSVDVEHNLAPRADIDYDPKKPVTGETVSFDGSKSDDLDGYIDEFDWEVVAPTDSIVAGTTRRGETFEVAFPNGRMYEVQLRVTDDDGATTTASQSVNVSGRQARQLTVVGPSEVDPEVDSTFEADLDHDGWVDRYEWTGDLGVESPTVGETLTTQYTEPGDYELTVTAYATATGNGRSESATHTVTVNDRPFFESVNVPSRIRQYERASLSATVADDNDAREALTVEWSGAGGKADATGSHVTTDRLSPGRKQISVTVSDDHGLDTTEERELYVDPKPSLSVSTPDVVGTGDDATVVATLSDNTDQLPRVTFEGAYEETFTEVASPEIRLTDSFETGGEREVTVTVEDDLGQTVSRTASFYVDSDPTVDIVTSRDLTQPVAEGETVTLGLEYSDDRHVEYVRWSDNVDTDGDTVRQVFPPGEHTVSATVVDTIGQQDSDAVTFTVDAEPTVDLDAPSERNEGQTAPLTAETTDDDGTSNLTYAWTGPGLDDAAERTVETAALDPGTVDVRVTATDEVGQTATDSAEIYVDRKPEVSIVAPSEVDEGTPVTFETDVDDDGKILATDWSGAFDAQGAPVTKTLPPGTHEVTVEVTDDNSQTATDTHELTVDARPSVEIEADDYVKAGQRASLTANPTDDEPTSELSYEWSGVEFDHGQTAQTATTRTLQSGSYEIACEVTDDRGQTGNATHEVIIDQPPSVSFVDPPSEVLAGSTHTLSVDVDDDYTPDADLTVEWDGVASGTGHSKTITFPDSGVATVTATVTDVTDQTQTTSISVAIDTPPEVAFESGLPTTLRTDESATFRLDTCTDDHGIRSVNWSGPVNGDGRKASLATSMPGDYTVTATAVDTSGQATSVSHDFEVVEDDRPDVFISGTKHVRPARRAGLSADASDDFGIDRYEWSGPGIDGETTADVTTRELGAGTYDVSVTVWDTYGQSRTATDTVHVEYDSAPDLTLSVDGDTSVTPGTTLTFTASASDDFGLDHVEWSGAAGGHGTEKTVTFDATGSYDVTATAVDTSGQETSRTKTITVERDDDAPTADIQGDLVVYENTTVTYAAGANDDHGIASIDWGGHADGETGSSATVYFGSPGSYGISVDVTDTIGQTAHDSVSVTVKDSVCDTCGDDGDDGDDGGSTDEPPTVSISGPSAVSLYSTATYTASGSDPDGGGVTYSWGTSTKDVTFNSPGTQTVSVTTTDDEGNTASASMTVDVRDDVSDL